MAKGKGRGAKRVTRKQMVAMLEQLFERNATERYPLKEIFRTLGLDTHPAKMLCMDVLDALLLDDFITLSSPRDDTEREYLFRGTIDGFTTRGQTYLVIIRADAYSPRFGENDSVQDGTTLATTHAIVELFRDPCPARAPDGSLPSDGVRPVAYHNWYVRSFRVF